MIESRRRLRLGALLLAISIAIGVAVTYLGAPAFDEELVVDARELRGGWFGEFMRGLSEVGYSLWLIPLALVVGLVLGVARSRWRDALLVVLATPVAATVTRVLKETFDRVRPADGVDLLIAGFSMPSGHAASSAALATSLVLVTHPGGGRRRAVLVAVATLALLVGVSRVVLGAHYPSDVVAGFCSGVGTTLLAAAVIGRAPIRIPRRAALD